MKECKCFACQQHKEYENSIIGMREVPIYKCINSKEMKTKTIEVKFPTIEGMKVENASVDLKNGVSVVEYVEDVKFKKGDVVYCEYNHTDKWKWVAIIDEIDSYYCGDYYVAYWIKRCGVADGSIFLNSYQDASGILARFATPSEAQQLFDALEKDGKYWDSENLEVKELSLSDRIDRIAFDSKNMSVAEISKKIKNIIDKEVNKAVNEIYK